MVIVACCTWYFNHNSDTKGNAKISTGFAWLFKYHWGSLALGSFILAIIWAVKIILSVVEKAARRSGVGSNIVVRCVLCCLQCCVSCIERCFKFINRNAYIQIALTSENFCTSAVNGFTLFLKHAGKFSMVLSVGGLFMVLGKISVASLTTFCGYLIIDGWPSVRDSIDSPVFPLVVIFIIAYTVAAVFISLYGISSNTILQCFLVDVDISEQAGKQGGTHRPPALEKFVYIA